MSELFYYKIWDPDLCQYVARQHPALLADIQSSGGIVIQSGTPRPGDDALDISAVVLSGRGGIQRIQSSGK